MNNDIFERLTIDRSLGALSDDMEALFSAYLQDHPEASMRVRQYDEAVSLARRVLQDDIKTVLPPFPNERLKHALRTQRRWVIISRTVALAACLIIGVSLGALLFHPQPAPPGDVQYQMADARDSIYQTTEHTIQNKYSFWSPQRLYEQSRRVRYSGPWYSIQDLQALRREMGGDS